MAKYDEFSCLHKYAPDDARECIERLIDKVLADGHSVTVNNGGDHNEITRETDRDVIMTTLGATGEDYIRIVKDGKVVGWFNVIYENGLDLFSDFLSNDYCCQAVNHAIQEDLFT